ncbi:MAG: 4Fe-4S dicluster domain-containing protein [Verrucomicrobia bacterium]|nr:4Fe-4S dicluster domain-containing protein [Verrucomicrobiota bacterium]
MNETRREFLGGSLIAGAAVGVGLLADKLVQRSARLEKPGPLTPALTPQGKLIQVATTDAGVAHQHPMPPHAGTALGREEARQGVPGRKWVMVIDLAKCSGCKNCTIACGKMHGTPVDREWIRVFRMQDARHTAPYWFPKPCFHCDNPPCTKVCPVGATYKRQDGIVLIDNERCIGCRFCMAACPYSTRYFNWGRPDNSLAVNAAYSPETGVPRRVGTVEKCDFCPEMAREGILPACVTSCDMAAVYFGDQNEDAVTNADKETVSFSQLLEERAGYRYLAELGTEPRVYYLPPKNRDFPKPSSPHKHKPESPSSPEAHSSHAHAGMSK